MPLSDCISRTSSIRFQYLKKIGRRHHTFRYTCETLHSVLCFYNFNQQHFFKFT